jgi:LmbE family N-acetylglucosaminyl deacetylase
LYIHGTDKSNTWVDITEMMDLKIKALQQHASQVNAEEVDKWMRDWAAEEAGDKGMKYAESYKVMRLVREKGED